MSSCCCCCFFPFFGVELFFGHFTATKMKNVIPIHEARLVRPRSSNDPSFTFFFFTVPITKVCFCRHVSSHEDSYSIG